MLDCSNPRSIVLGRPGSGKTALLRQVQRSVTHSVVISPEELALNYITTSRVLQFFEAAGVHLDVFYTLLWRHVLTVELLRKKFSIDSEGAQSAFLGFIYDRFGASRKKRVAFEYLTKWGDQFWQETPYRTKEFTQKLEQELLAETPFGTQASSGAKGATSLTESQRIEALELGQRAVNHVQIKELGDVIAALAEDVFNDPRQPYYVLIDKLDEDWVDDRIRFKLIKALFEAIRTFRQVRNVKIIVALRTDLHYRVLKMNTSAGFQTEKHLGFTLPIKWKRDRLVQVLDTRVNLLCKRQYTRDDVHLQDLLPNFTSKKISGRSSVDYLLDRTFLRPREAIIFFNSLIETAEGKAKITVETIRKTEVRYSNERLQSLLEEWRREYPALMDVISLVRNRSASFPTTAITQDELNDFCVRFIDAHPNDDLTPTLEQHYLAGKIGREECLRALLRILYHVGVLGIKQDPRLARQWSFVDNPLLPEGQPNDSATLAIHQTFWAALSIPPVIPDWSIDDGG